MRVSKQAQGGQRVETTREELEQINRLSRRALDAQEVYTFAVRLCDNEVDRDGERFPKETLEELAQLFVGKSGIFDHDWSAKGQAARIYRTRVVEEKGRVTQAGDPYCWLEGHAYMVRTPGCADLIAEIEGGIKKEVSVGCAVERAVCSVCGKDRKEGCGHHKGERYGGKVCYDSLEGARDAYEFSFVAVPAQPGAGVLKGLACGACGLRELVKGHAGASAELEELERQAGLGRRYLDGLRSDVIRLGLLADRGLEADTLRRMAGKLDEGELLEMKGAFTRQAQRSYPLDTQLSYAAKETSAVRDEDAFLI